MKPKDMGASWHELSEEVLTGMQEWRLQHPKANFAEIETELDREEFERRLGAWMPFEPAQQLLVDFRKSRAWCLWAGAAPPDFYGTEPTRTPPPLMGV